MEEPHINQLTAAGIDGNRRITPSNLDVKEVVYEDGKRPIKTAKAQTRKTLAVDGDRPITSDNSEPPDMLRDYID